MLAYFQHIILSFEVICVGRTDYTVYFLSGHSSVLHGCTVEDDALIGMGATLLDGVHVEKNAMVAAGAVVKENTRIPTGEVNMKIECMV